MNWKCFLLVAILMIFSLGCSVLKKRINAYEKQDLSQPGMEFIDNPIESSAIQHMLNAREGSVGGFGGAGGGCGCN